MNKNLTYKIQIARKPDEPDQYTGIAWSDGQDVVVATFPKESYTQARVELERLVKLCYKGYKLKYFDGETDLNVLEKIQSGNNPELAVEWPKTGEDIYIPTRMSLDHGWNDIHGGLAKVLGLKDDGYGNIFVIVKEVDRQFNRQDLFEMQDELKKKFGDKRAYPDPDYG